MTQPVTFLLWTDIPAEHEAGFNEWYNREHIPDRVFGIPGFIQARRFAAVEGGPQYATLYEVAGPEVFRNEAYLAMRRTPDPHSQHYIALFRNVIRIVGRPDADMDAVAVKIRAAGVTEGAWVRFVALKAPAAATAHRLHNAGPALVVDLARRPGVVRVRLFSVVPELQEGAVRNMQGTTRAGLRGPDRLADALLMIEAATEAQLAAVEADALAACRDWTLLGSARMRQVMRVAAS